MSKNVETYFENIKKAARTKLLKLFKNKQDKESIRQYNWCGKLTYTFKCNDKKLDLQTTDNPATFTFKATELKQPPNSAKELTHDEVDDHADNVAGALVKALKDKKQELTQLQEKGFLFCHNKLYVSNVDWRNLTAQTGAIDITFFTYDK